LEINKMAKSEYIQREEAAKKQLGAKGVKKRVKQLPTAARASLREMTGIDISRKGVSVDPIGLAMAVSPFKLLKASKALRAAGKVGKAAAVEARIGSKVSGGKLRSSVDFYKRGYYDSWPKKSLEEGIPPFEFPRSLPSNAGARGRLARAIENRGKSESVFPRASTGTLRSIKPLPKSIKPLNSYNSSQSTNYSLPLGLGIIGGAAVVGANAAKDNARKAAIKKASTKTRKGQTRGR
jgi:hypothetical protein